MKMHITVDDTLQALENAVEDYGEGWVDPNSPDGSTSMNGCVNRYQDPRDQEAWRYCIAGHVFKQWGWDFAFEFGNDLNNSAADVALSVAYQDYDVTFEDLPAIEILLCKAQQEQDKSRTWGVAVKEAYKRLDEIRG